MRGILVSDEVAAMLKIAVGVEVEIPTLPFVNTLKMLLVVVVPYWLAILKAAKLTGVTSIICTSST